MKIKWFAALAVLFTIIGVVTILVTDDSNKLLALGLGSEIAAVVCAVLSLKE